MWHVSVARINREITRIVSLAEWSPQVFRNAREIARKALLGVGGEWQKEELGEMALHVRRRLRVDEMTQLHRVNPACPVFTHGEALRHMAGVM